jgi:acyl carrier protein
MSNAQDSQKSLDTETLPATGDDLEARVRSIVAKQLDVEESQVSLKTSFEGELGAASLERFELVMALEDAFGITISDEEAAEIKTLEDTLNYIRNALQKKGN